MREILFRGKNYGDSDWIYGGYYSDGGRHHIINDVEDAYNIDPETIGQYTGLNDKSGNKIFEGDIVRQTYPQEYVGVPRQKPNIGVVEFAEGAFGVHIYESNSLISKGTQFFFQYAIEREVIGNIHENKELLYGGDPQ